MAGFQARLCGPKHGAPRECEVAGAHGKMMCPFSLCLKTPVAATAHFLAAAAAAGDDDAAASVAAVAALTCVRWWWWYVRVRACQRVCVGRVCEHECATKNAAAARAQQTTHVNKALDD